MTQEKEAKLKILTKDQISEVHLATLDVLERVGVTIHESSVISLLRDAGAYVDDKRQRVYFPTHLVEEAIAKTPRRFTLHARDPKNSVDIPNSKVHFAPGGTPIQVLDLETGECRRSTLKDLEQLVRLADALENIHVCSNMVFPTDKSDVSDTVAIAYSMLAQMSNTTKCIEGDAVGKLRANDTIRIGAILAGDIECFRKKPTIYGIVNPVSPLSHGKEMLEGLTEYARYGAPIIIAPEVQAGGTGPVTLAGTLVQQNAEILSGIIITQLVNPGAPVLYGTVSSVMDMRTGGIALGAVEAGLIAAASAQLAHSYGLPCRCTAGNTDSKVSDVQAGYEKALALLLAAMAGADLIYDAAGLIESSLTFSYQQMIIDNEILGMALRSLKGVEVTHESLALDIIQKVGPERHYLGHEHTRKWFTIEHFIPKLSDRSRRELWKKQGGKSLAAIARGEAKKILETHRPEPLEQEIQKQVESIIKEVEKRERSKII